MGNEHTTKQPVGIDPILVLRRSRDQMNQEAEPRTCSSCDLPATILMARGPALCDHCAWLLAKNLTCALPTDWRGALTDYLAWIDAAPGRAEFFRAFAAPSQPGADILRRRPLDMTTFLVNDGGDTWETE